MKKSPARLILAGGGHTHALLLKMHLMRPLPYEIILASEHPLSFYSGMIPGFIAGSYDADDLAIDLQRLSSMAGIRFIHDTVTGLDKDSRQVYLHNHPSLSYDIISINTGSVPGISSISSTAGIGIKPLMDFIPYWKNLCALEETILKTQEMAVIGGGAAGIETALAIQHRFGCRVHLFNEGRLLGENSPASSEKLLNYLQTRGIHVHFGRVTSVKESSGTVTITGEYPVKIPRHHSLPVVIYLTAAEPPSWIAASGLATDERGFILTGSSLQSLSAPNIFVCGDSGVIQDDKRPRAGVYAVRQAKYLFYNLQNYSTGRLKSYKPQKHFLVLIGTGDGKGFASRGGRLAGPYSWIWRWKQHIDTRFMRLFHDLAMAPAGGEMRCLGCGSKIGATTLRRVLNKIQLENPVKNTRPVFNDDAAVFVPPKNRLLLQTVDYFPLLNMDVYTAGRICANHCLNDIYAMGGKPEYALAVLSLPQEKYLEETLYHLLSGINAVLKENNVLLAGGHTAEGKQLSAGLALTGSVEKGLLLRKEITSARLDLILTKPLGTGTIFAAEMRGQAKGIWIGDAIRTMLQSNQKASEIFRKYKVNACTDITGFGLAGHLLEMLAGAYTAEISMKSLPVIAGAYECMAKGIFSTLHDENESILPYLSFTGPLEKIKILFDPQTAGGLLAAVPQIRTEPCMKELIRNGYQAVKIGTVTMKSKNKMIRVI